MNSSPEMESLKRVFEAMKALAKDMRKKELGGRFSPKAEMDEAMKGKPEGEVVAEVEVEPEAAGMAAASEEADPAETAEDDDAEAMFKKMGMKRA